MGKPSPKAILDCKWWEINKDKICIGSLICGFFDIRIIRCIQLFKLCLLSFKFILIEKLNKEVLPLLLVHDGPIESLVVQFCLTNHQQDERKPLSLSKPLPNPP